MIYVIARRSESTLGLTFYATDGWDVDVEGAAHFESLAECQERVASLDGYEYDDEPPAPIALCCDGQHQPRTEWSLHGERVWSNGGRHFVTVHCQNCLVVGQIEIDVVTVKWL